MEVLERIADQLYKNAFEFGLQVKKVRGTKKSMVVDVRVPVFKNMQDWFVQPKKAVLKSTEVPSYMRGK